MFLIIFRKVLGHVVMYDVLVYSTLGKEKEERNK